MGDKNFRLPRNRKENRKEKRKEKLIEKIDQSETNKRKIESMKIAFWIMMAVHTVTTSKVGRGDGSHCRLVLVSERNESGDVQLQEHVGGGQIDGQLGPINCQYSFRANFYP